MAPGDQPSRNPELLTAHNSFDILAEDPQASELDSGTTHALEASIGLTLECQDSLKPLVTLFEGDRPPITYYREPRMLLWTKKALCTDIQPIKSWRQTDAGLGIIRMFNKSGRNITPETSEVTKLNMEVIEVDGYFGKFKPTVEISFGKEAVDDVELAWCEGDEESRKVMNKLIGGSALEAFLRTVAPDTDFGLNPKEQFPVHRVNFNIKEASLQVRSTGYGTQRGEVTPPKNYQGPDGCGAYHVQLRPLYSFGEDGQRMVRDQAYHKNVSAVEEFSGTKFADSISPSDYLKALEATVALLRAS